MAPVVTRIWDEILTFLAVVFLFSFSYPAFNETISDSTNHYLGLIQWVCWFAFAVDLIYGIWKAESKKEYLLSPQASWFIGMFLTLKNFNFKIKS